MQKENPQKKEGRQILVFKVASDELGLDISCVREVLKPQEVYPLPKALDFIEGVINLRGHIVALIDLRKRLHGKPTEEPGKRVIICKVNKLIVGLAVDSLKEIIALSEENIRPTPEVAVMQMEADVTMGLAKIGEKIIPILDLAQIITKKGAAELSGLER
jgi:purine-binding chemotaxis protein CheW